MRSVLMALSVLALHALEPARAQPLPAEPDGFRMSDYSAEVPAGVAGAHVLTTATALRSLIAEVSPALFDVFPAPNRPAQLPTDVLWIEPSRETLPNAAWLANVGMGPAPAELEALLADKLANATRGDKSFPVVIFCEPRCWHSWNAAKRAVLLGYANVYWYKGGVDDWRVAGHPLQTVHPMRPK